MILLCGYNDFQFNETTEAADEHSVCSFRASMELNQVVLYEINPKPQCTTVLAHS